MIKLCSSCSTYKDISEFPKNTVSTTGYYSRCKKCVNEISRKKREQEGVPERYHRRILEGSLICGKCKVVQPVTCFNKSSIRKTGYSSTCKDCAKKWRMDNKSIIRNGVLKRQYGITLIEYQVLLRSQGGGCAICGAPELESTFGKLHVDHDHKTGIVRGLLCGNCNTALGLANESKEKLQLMISYLDKFSVKNKIEIEEVA